MRMLGGEPVDRCRSEAPISVILTRSRSIAVATWTCGVGRDGSWARGAYGGGTGSGGCGGSGGAPGGGAGGGGGGGGGGGAGGGGPRGGAGGHARRRRGGR